MQDHAFNTRTEAADSTPAVSFFAGGSTASLLGPFRIHRAEAISERRRTTSTVTNVLHRNAFDEAKSGRCDSVIRAAGSNRSRQLRGVFSAGKFVQDPPPIVFGIGVLTGVLSRCIAWGKGKAIAAGISSRKSPGFEVESQGYLTVIGYDGSFLQFRNPGSMQARSPPKGIASSLRAFSCSSKVRLSIRQRI